MKRLAQVLIVLILLFWVGALLAHAQSSTFAGRWQAHQNHLLDSWHDTRGRWRHTHCVRLSAYHAYFSCESEVVRKNAKTRCATLLIAQSSLHALDAKIVSCVGFPHKLNPEVIP